MVKRIEKSEQEWRRELTPEQFEVCRNKGTEHPFSGAYYNCKEDGIYRCACCGSELFHSQTKFDSGTGWPSFTKPLVAENIVERTDYKLLLPRTEIRSRYADSHLGHVFPDGPRDRGGMRYCINSAALRFVPVERLEAEGYAELLPLFRKPGPPAGR